MQNKDKLNAPMKTKNDALLLLYALKHFQYQHDIQK